MLLQRAENNQTSLIPHSGTVAIPAPEETFAELLPECDEFTAMMRAEGIERRKQMAREPKMAALRARAIAIGPPDLGVPATADPVADVRAMMASASFHYPAYEWYGLLFVHQGRLTEMRHSGCLTCTCDGTDCCDCCCLVQIDLAPLRNWQAQRDYLKRRGIKRYMLSVFSWCEVPTPDEAFQTAAAANFWPGTHHLYGVRPVPFYLADGTLQEWPGLHQPGGWWGTPASIDGQPLPETLADKLVAMVGWRGTKAVLAKEVGFDGTIMAFNAELKRVEPELRARGVAIIKTGRRAGRKGGEEYSLVLLAKNQESLGSLGSLGKAPDQLKPAEALG